MQVENAAAAPPDFDIYALIDRRKAEMRDTVDAFVSALGGTKPINIGMQFAALDIIGAWRPAMRKACRLATLHPSIQAEVLAAWVENGNSIRDSVNDDALLVRALRVLLPTYTGPAVTLYRGDAAGNRRRRTYGMSWSANREVARSFALGMWRTCQGGSVVVQTEAPPEAILCAAHLHNDDAYGEAEYLVDRRLLGRVTVLERYEECGLDDLAGGQGRDHRDGDALAG